MRLVPVLLVMASFTAPRSVLSSWETHHIELAAEGNINGEGFVGDCEDFISELSFNAWFNGIYDSKEIVPGSNLRLVNFSIGDNIVDENVTIVAVHGVLGSLNHIFLPSISFRSFNNLDFVRAGPFPTNSGGTCEGFWITVESLKEVRPLGDSNNDGEFGTGDLIAVFQDGKFETGDLASYEQGDWNLDGVFGTGDLILAFQQGDYEKPSAAQAVPEPSAIALLLIGILAQLTVTTRKT